MHYVKDFIGNDPYAQEFPSSTGAGELTSDTESADERPYPTNMTAEVLARHNGPVVPWSPASVDSSFAVSTNPVSASADGVGDPEWTTYAHAVMLTESQTTPGRPGEWRLQ